MILMWMWVFGGWVTADGCKKKVYGINFETELHPPPPFGIDGDLAHECLEGGSSPIVKDLKFIEGMI